MSASPPGGDAVAAQRRVTHWRCKLRAPNPLARRCPGRLDSLKTRV